MPPIIIAIVGAGLASFGAAGGYLLWGLITSSMLFSFGASLVLGGLSSMLAKKPTLPNFKAEIAGRNVTARQAVAPHRWVYGEVRIGGTITFIHTSGTNNEYLHLVITLTGHEVNAINNIYFDGKQVALDGSGNGTGKWAGYVRVKKALGTSGQTAYADLVSESGGKWTTNHRQRGCAGIYVRLKFNPDLFPSTPNITAEVQGRKMYDPRDAQTKYTDNWALCVRDYLLNGLGVPASKIDDTLINAAANLSDEDVNLDPTGTEKRYTCVGTFTTDKRPADILSALLTAGAGELAYVGGKWNLYGGAWRAPTISLSEDDLRGPVTVQSRLTRSELFNAVKGTFVSAANEWQPSDFPPLTNSTYETEDSGERIWRDIELPFTVSSPTAQRLAKLELEQARRQKTVRLPMKMTAYQVQPPDVVQFSYARFNWTNKAFKVVKQELVSAEDAEGHPYPAVDLVLRETDSAVYGWSAEEDADPTPPDPTLPDPTAVADPTGLSLSAQTETRLDFKYTFLRATWTAPADEAVTNGGKIEIEHKKSSSGTWIALEPIPGDATTKIIAQVAHNIDYDVRIRSVNIHGTKGNWVQQLNYTVVDVASPKLQNLSGDGKLSDPDQFESFYGATRAVLDKAYLDSGQRPTTLRRAADDLAAGDVFKKNEGTLDEVVESTNRKHFLAITREQLLRRVGTHGQNLLFNWGFEDGLVFWSSGTGRSVVTDSTKAHTGNKYFQLSTDGVTLNSAHVDEAGALKYFEVVEGDVINFGGWGYRESGDGDIRYFIEVRDKDKLNPAWYITSSIASAAWAKVAQTYVVLAGMKYVKFHVEVKNPTVATVGRFDDCWLQIARSWTGLSDRPTELTDGRVAEVLLSGASSGILKSIRIPEGLFANKVAQTIANATVPGNDPPTGWRTCGARALYLAEDIASITYTMTLPTQSNSGTRGLSGGIGFAIHTGGAPASPDVSRTGNGSLTHNSPTVGDVTLTIYVEIIAGSFRNFGGGGAAQDILKDIISDGNYT